MQSYIKPLGKTLGPCVLMPSVKLGNMIDRTEIIAAKIKLNSVQLLLEF